MPKFEKKLLAAVLREDFTLEEVIDVDQLVTRHELRKRGIDPAKIRLEADWSRTASLISVIPHDKSKEVYLVYNPDFLKNLDAEDFYVLIAHETAHLTQPPDELRKSGIAMAKGKVTHKDDRWELDAQIWEARQATKFGWDDDRYRLFVDRVYKADILTASGRKEAKERPASFATMRRRPGVNVRRHLRRRR